MADRELEQSVALAIYGQTDFKREKCLELARAALKAIAGQGLVVVPREPTREMDRKGREQMPVEQDYWQEGGTMHCGLRPLHECVPPGNVWQAMIDAAPQD